MEILRIENLSFRYPQAQQPALETISLSVQSGEFVVLCGASGCGKTTLLRLIKKELAPAGEKQGQIYYRGVLQEQLDPRTCAGEIGYVLQNPDSQIVTDKVWHELAFGLENMGLPTGVIRRRVGEMASYFGIQNWFEERTDTLSGGQKQLLNLAAVMVMQPKILILDEPTGQLDPIAAADFIATLQKLNREFGLTVILAEHRLEDVFPIADRVVLMEEGRVQFDGAPKAVGAALQAQRPDHSLKYGLPSAVRIFSALQIQDECPLTVREGRDFLERHFAGGGGTEERTAPQESKHGTGEVTVQLKHVWFRYGRELPDVLRETSLRLYRGELYCLLGGNGTGKTTVLNVIAGLNKAYRGSVRICGKPIAAYRKNTLYRHGIAYLPQNPQTVFVKEQIREDFAQLLRAMEIPEGAQEEKIEAVADKVGVRHLLDRHPYDLSGGEQQKCALAKMLLLEPQILLLDEPTKGLDAYSKQVFGEILRACKQEGMTVFMVTHDVEFAAENADRCALFFNGEILCEDAPTRFFSENNFYTTAANRMARSLWPDAVTCGQVIERCLSEQGGTK